MEDKEAIIERVSAFMSLCLTITTSGSTKLSSFVLDYQALRSDLIGTAGLWLPLWISASTTPASVLAHVQMEKGSGNGSW